ncbi:uncharacterized protein LOC111478892 [Cucurbita maxima]|uniref:Uncharacterized protein LOC111478892 n=1 Tax=Cucurbita maxima TaxID=3661 RepID=A0A6J1IVD0_CUCMA|nr:uncharacterized protein LOC111478892 [Cucurbita maxima]
MEDGFGMRLIHSTLTPRIAPSLILDSGAPKMVGMMTVTEAVAADGRLRYPERLLFPRRGEIEYGCNGSISWVATDIEALGGGTFGSKLNLSFLSKAFSCSLRVNYSHVHDEPR